MKTEKQTPAVIGIVVGVALALCATVFWTIPVRAQMAGATLTGLVTDSSGAAIPGAKVSATNVSTREVREGETNGGGFYSLPNLLPGEYEIVVAAQGFTKTVQKGIALTVGAQQALNVTLKPGEVTQIVEVMSTPPRCANHIFCG